jgi:hypothetical protein
LLKIHSLLEREEKKTQLRWEKNIYQAQIMIYKIKSRSINKYKKNNPKQSKQTIAKINEK